MLARYDPVFDDDLMSKRGMVLVEGGSLIQGSEHFYPEEQPIGKGQPAERLRWCGARDLEPRITVVEPAAVVEEPRVHPICMMPFRPGLLTMHLSAVAPGVLRR